MSFLLTFGSFLVNEMVKLENYVISEETGCLCWQSEINWKALMTMQKSEIYFAWQLKCIAPLLISIPMCKTFLNLVTMKYYLVFHSSQNSKQDNTTNKKGRTLQKQTVECIRLRICEVSLALVSKSYSKSMQVDVSTKGWGLCGGVNLVL